MFTKDQIKQIKELLDHIQDRLDARCDQINIVRGHLSRQISREANNSAELISEVVFDRLDSHETGIA